MTLAPKNRRQRITTLAYLALLLVPTLSACSGQQASAAAVATALQPSEDGFSFANFPSSSFPDVNFDEVDLVEMFGSGSGVCVDGISNPCVLTAEAAAWAQMINQARASGHCVGLAAIAALRFNEQSNPKTVQLAQDEGTIRVVSRAFATQFLPEVQQETSNWLAKNLDEKVQALEESFKKGSIDYTLGLYSPNGGHAVTPFAVEYPSKNVARVMVYDSNWPGRNRYVDIDMKKGTWTFSFSGEDPENDLEAWSGGAADLDISSVNFQNSTCPFCGANVGTKNTMLVIRSESTDWAIGAGDGEVTANGVTGNSGSEVLKIKGAAGSQTHDYVVNIPAQSKSSSVDSPIRMNFKGVASVYAVLPKGIASFKTSPNSSSPVVLSGGAISSADPNVTLTLASENLVASSSGSSSTLSIEGATLNVSIALPNGEIVQQKVDESTPVLKASVDQNGGSLSLLSATTNGVVEKTEIASNGTRTKSISTEPLNLNSVVAELPKELQSRANPLLPPPTERSLNNPNYRVDTAYEKPKEAAKSETTSQAVEAAAETTSSVKSPTVTTTTSTTSTTSTSTTSTSTTLPRVATTVAPRSLVTTTTVPPSTTTVPPSTTTVPPSTTTVPPAQYVVTFNYNGATGGNSAASSTYIAGGSAVTLPTPTRIGYSLNGWYSNVALTTLLGEAGAGVRPSSAITAYAKWTANILNVATDEQGGSSIGSISTTTGGQILTSPGTPTRSGYVFSGWFTSAIGGSAIAFPYLHGQTAGFSLYAQWEAVLNSFAVSGISASFDRPFEMVPMSDGSMVVTGIFAGAATFGETNLVADAEYNLFIARLSSSGTWLWAKKLHSGLLPYTTAGGEISSMTVDVAPDYSIVIAGKFSGSVSFGSTNLTSCSTYNGAQNAYVAKLDSDGSWLWAAQTSGCAYISPFTVGVAATSDGSAVISLSFQYSPMVVGSTTISNTNAQRGVIAKISSAGAWSWATPYAALCNSKLETDRQDNIFFFGSCAETDGDIRISAWSNRWDGVVAKLSSEGVWQWQSVQRGGDYVLGRVQALKVQADGTIVVAGYAGAGTALGSVSFSQHNQYIAKLTAQGAWDWVKLPTNGGSGLGGFSGITTKTDGSIVVAGYYYGWSTPSFGSFAIAQTNHDRDIAVVELKQNGDWVSATRIGTLHGGWDGTEDPFDIETQPDGTLVLLGSFTSTNLAIGNRSLSTRGSSDIFVVTL
jgi:uncharacterized repeat protein (TIGR02543 family)